MKINAKNIKNKKNERSYYSKLTLKYIDLIHNDNTNPLNIEKGEYNLLFDEYERRLLKRTYDYLNLKTDYDKTQCFIIALNLVIIGDFFNLNSFDIFNLLNEVK
ncbi:MAG: hypothetical protein IKH85_00845 [Methanobrevibacter sp.]|uniref:hypothetical protein n=1 Tax=Methanobrevibacter sp. TaxID=66852 RepID=UPI0025CD645A|nr:hypothetical protein [Methanobrevibacter sp.]MBR6992602.1 hypothetical protein [Methanobrevibacter sp.]